MKAPEERGEGPEVDRGRTQPHEVRDDPAQLAGDDPKHLAPLRNLDAHQLFDRQGQTHVVGHRRQIVHAVGERHDLIVVAVLAEFFKPTVQVADMWNDPHHDFPVELHHQTQNTVGCRVLGADIHQHVVATECGLFPIGQNPHAGLVCSPQGNPGGFPLRVDAGRGDLKFDRAFRAHRQEFSGSASFPRSPRASRSRISAGIS